MKEITLAVLTGLANMGEVKEGKAPRRPWKDSQDAQRIVDAERKRERRRIRNLKNHQQ